MYETELEEFARHCMWRRIFDGRTPTKAERTSYARQHDCMRPSDFKPNEADYRAADWNLTLVHIDRENHPYHTNKLDDMNTAQACTTNNFHLDDLWNDQIQKCSNPPVVAIDVPCVPAKPMPVCKPYKKENNMGYETTAASIEGTQREHLQTRLRSVKNDKTEALKDTFHMKPVSLKTEDELIAAMKSGNVRVAEGYKNPEDGKLYYGLSSLRIEAFDPAKDEAGYKAAAELVDKAYTDAKDKVIVLPLEKGLEALNSFESATFH